MKVDEQIGILVCDRDTGRTALPHAHQPHGIEAEGGDGIPFD